MQEWIINTLSQITPEEEMILSGNRVNKNLYTSQTEFIIEPGKLLTGDNQISIRPHTRFIDFPAHKHNFIEMIYMCKGETTHTLNQDTVQLKEGEILILNQNILHSIKKAEAKDIALNIVMLPSFLDYTFELSGGSNIIGKFLVQTFKQDCDVASYLKFSVGDSVTVQNLMENIIIHLLNQETMHTKLIKVSMALLMLELLEHTENLIASSLDRQSLIVTEVLHEVEENYLNPNLSAIASQYNVSLAYVSSLVKERRGKTFSELLEERRMELASLYLIDTDLPIEDIIYLTGYSSNSFFYRVFKNRFGQTPNQYRNSKSI